MLKKIGSLISTIVMIVLIVIACILYVPKLFGITPMVVLSGSMEPTYAVGSLIFVDSLSSDTIVETGDNVTFYFGDTKTVVTHRVIGVHDDGTYTTKGDANNSEDGKLKHSNIIGIAKDFCVPFLGYLAAFLNTKAGFFMVIVAIVVMLGFSFLGDLFNKKNKKVGDGCENTEKG